MMGQLAVRRLLCNHLERPLGFNLGEHPCLSWVTDAPPESKIKTQVEVSVDRMFSVILYDSGKREDIDNVFYLHNFIQHCFYIP